MDLKWFFPSTVEELVSLMEKDDPLLHSGGTGISRDRLSRAGVVADLSHMGWNLCSKESGSIHLGSTCSFSQVVDFMVSLSPEHILVKALSLAASTQQRNRITIGGSVAFFPLWSDLVGPLIALDSKVEVVGANAGICSLKEYISHKGLFKGSAIKEVFFPLDEWQTWYYREIRVGFDYPGFTITLMVKRDGDSLSDLRAVVVGTKSRYSILKDLEEKLPGRKCSDIDLVGLGNSLDIEFPDKKSGSGAYFRQVAGVWIERGLSELLER